MINRVSIEEIIRIYKIDYSFLDALIESELLHPESHNSIRYIHHDELGKLEKFCNWHYNLDVNLAGIEIIQDLLRKIEALQQEKLEIRNQTYQLLFNETEP